MTEEDKQQFAAALAERYKQLNDEWDQASATYYQTSVVHGNTIGEFIAADKQYALAFEKLCLFNTVIDSLPNDIRLVFFKEYSHLTEK
ncbi:hypothetical protein [Paenibacillus sp. OSY-SE]|uniref:hypothetical protein n=1 Tax=Paenibacillus sp. OSY-SE TaxID=1196323 RepID=UPI000366E73C|nr:hypothetical protein [Paenibacillus sp. OSY-SE]